MSKRVSRQGKDWSPAYVVYRLHDAGLTLSALAERHHYHVSAIGKALRQPWPAVEGIVAAALEIEPREIWPSRYDSSGEPRQGRRQSNRRHRVINTILERAA